MAAVHRSEVMSFMQEQGKIFRKVAVDRLSSPDELTEMASFTRPYDWLILCVVGALLLGAIVWSSVAKLPIMTEGSGVLQRSGQMESGPLQASVFVSEKAVRQIKPGLAVQMTLEGFPPQQFGFLSGTVIRVHSTTLSDTGLRQFLDRQDLAELCISQQLRVRVDVALAPEANGTGRQPARELYRQLAAGTKVNAEITLGQEHPVAWILPWLRGGTR
jgi:hypothetical protein